MKKYIWKIEACSNVTNGLELNCKTINDTMFENYITAKKACDILDKEAEKQNMNTLFSPIKCALITDIKTFDEMKLKDFIMLCI